MAWGKGAGLYSLPIKIKESEMYSTRIEGIYILLPFMMYDDFIICIVYNSMSSSEELC